MVHEVEDGEEFLLLDAFQVQKRILLGFAVRQDSPEERGASCQDHFVGLDLFEIIQQMSFKVRTNCSLVKYKLTNLFVEQTDEN